MARERRVQESGEEGSPAWMNTYGDMVTLLLTFFVLLFAFSTISETKWRDLVASFAGNPSGVAILDAPNDPSKPDINPVQPRPKQSQKDESLTPEEQREKEFQEILENLQEMVRENQLEFSLDISRDGDVISIKFQDNVLFNSGSSDLRQDGYPILTNVRDLLIISLDSIKIIHIEGHTDNVPIRTARFYDNWALSVSRACSVLRFMTATDEIPPQRISASGYGEFQPVDTNDTEVGKQHNRRVEFKIEKLPVEQESEGSTASTPTNAPATVEQESGGSTASTPTDAPATE